MSCGRLLVLVFFFVSAANALRENLLRKGDLPIRNSCGLLHLEILVSPLVGVGIKRQLQVQWEHAPMQNGDWIGLFATDHLAPRYHDQRLPPLLDVVQVTMVHGWANTTVFEQHIDPENLGYHGRCLDYYAAYFNAANQTMAATCLRVEPNWMWDLKSKIGNRTLTQVFIPGSHDSSAYKEYDEQEGETRVMKYVITQDEPVLGQLIYGARYIDLRVGYYEKSKEKWWGNHGVVRLHPLAIIFADIKKFLDNTHEIVILDVQEFPVGFGDTKEIHKLFINYLKTELGDYVASPSLGWGATFDQVWNTNRRLIVGYDDSQMVMESDFLWPAVQQKWGNVRSLPDLYSYLSSVMDRPPSAAWSAMAELTPNTLDVILNRLKGLRIMAESVNHDVTEWFRDPKWSPKTNTVAVDFLRGTGIVRAAIEWNYSQGQCPNRRN